MVRAVTNLRRSSTPADRGSEAVLYLDGVRVGEVSVKGFNASWGYGDFSPAPEFSAFAPLYGQWALLMHAQTETERPDRAIVEELSRAERLLDRIRAQLYFPKTDEWITVPQLAISNELLEWKEY